MVVCQLVPGTFIGRSGEIHEAPGKAEQINHAERVAVHIRIRVDAPFETDGIVLDKPFRGRVAVAEVVVGQRGLVERAPQVDCFDVTLPVKGHEPAIAGEQIPSPRNGGVDAHQL